MPSDEEILAAERRKGEEWGSYKNKLDQVEKTLEQIASDVKNIRKLSDDLYAIKMVEKIVFGLVSLVCIAVVTAMIKLVVMK